MVNGFIPHGDIHTFFSLTKAGDCAAVASAIQGPGGFSGSIYRLERSCEGWAKGNRTLHGAGAHMEVS